jgi:signal peptidase I
VFLSSQEPGRQQSLVASIDVFSDDPGRAELQTAGESMEDKGTAGASPDAGYLARVAWEFIAAILPALAVALFFNVYVVEAVTVKDGPSMEPNLYRGYRVVTEKVSYDFHPPRRGDVIVVDRPDGEASLIKRVVALPGETIEVRSGHAFVDGQPIDEPWVTHFGGPGYPPTVVPEDRVFVLGDNRAVSHDSRAIGPVSVESIKGRAWLICWPLSEFKPMP